MSSSDSRSHPLDLALFSERLEGDVELMRELASLYIAEYPGQLKELRLAVTGADAQRLRMAAHAILGTATNFSAKASARAARVLEAMGESGDISNAAEAADALAAELHQLRLALAAFLEDK
jgi:HPt (histidine-containing phosphotransfer) domain-containing protein